MAPALPVMRAETSVGRRFLGSSRASILPASMCVSVVPRSKHNGCRKIRVQHLISADRSCGNEVLLNEQLPHRQQQLDPDRKRSTHDAAVQRSRRTIRRNFIRRERPGSSATGRCRRTAQQRRRHTRRRAWRARVFSRLMSIVGDRHGPSNWDRARTPPGVRTGWGVEVRAIHTRIKQSWGGDRSLRPA